MNKLFVFFASVLIASPALSADEIIDCKNLDISKLSTEQVRNIQTICSPEKMNNITPDDVKEWASLGKEFSVAITETAKGLGVAANEFLTTPLGMMIAFYFLWDKIGGILIGIPLLIATWILYGIICRKLTIQSVEYGTFPVLWGLFHMKKVTNIEYQHGDSAWIWVGLAIPAFLVSTLILGSLIF